MLRLSQEEMRAFVEAHVQDSCWPVPLNTPLQPESVFRYGKGGRLLPVVRSSAKLEYDRRKRSRRWEESEAYERFWNPLRHNPCG